MYKDDTSTIAETRTLFEVGDDENGDAEEVRSVTSAKLGGLRDVR
jgi:hypothetical protein